jgi:hypothetical protein
MELSNGYIFQVGKIRNDSGEDMIELDRLVTAARSIVVFAGMEDDEDIYMVGCPATGIWKRVSQWDVLIDETLPELSQVLADQMTKDFGCQVSSDIVADSLASVLEEDEDGIMDALSGDVTVEFSDSHYFESADIGKSFCLKYSLSDLDDQGWEMDDVGHLIVPGEDGPINALDDPLAVLSFNNDDEYELDYTVVIYGISDSQETVTSVSEVSRLVQQAEARFQNGDSQEGANLLQQAINKSISSADYSACARLLAIKRYFPSNSQALKLLKTSVYKAVTTADFCTLAEIAASEDLLGSAKMGSHMLQGAMAKVASFGDAYQVAETAITLFGFRKIARKYIERAFDEFARSDEQKEQCVRFAFKMIWDADLAEEMVAKAGLQIDLREAEEDTGYDAGNVRSDSEVVQNIIHEIRCELDCIIDEEAGRFQQSGSFKVHPDYGPAKFYLDRVEGNYEMSLQNLVHHMMYQDGHYRKILNDRQYEEMESTVKNYPDAVYGPDSEEENFEQLQNVLDTIHYESIVNVAKELRGLGFDVSAFEEYLNED